MEPRIKPLEPPYEPATEEMLRKWMPPGAAIEPLALFRTLTVHPDLSSRMRPLGAGILGHGLVEPRERELLILRTCARAGAEYEWGVHATAFGPLVGLGEDELDATWHADADAFADADQPLIRLADELHDTATVSDKLWAELSGRYDDPQLLELVVICGWYRLIAYAIHAARVTPESWARRAAHAPRA
jgi:alkylhydroperoxidase family enzyme